MQINIEKKHFWIIACILIILIGASVIADSLRTHTFDEISGNIPASRITGKVASAASADSASYATTAGDSVLLNGKTSSNYGCIAVESSTAPVCGSCSSTYCPNHNNMYCPGDPADPVGNCPTGYTKKSEIVNTEVLSFSCPGKCVYFGNQWIIDCNQLGTCSANKKIKTAVCCPI